MKKLFSVRTIILAGSLLLQLSTLCFHSRGAAGDVDLSFDPGSGVNGTVYAIAVQSDGKAIIGGQFNTVKGLARINVARLNADGSGDTTFNPGTGINGVSSLALQSDGKVLVGTDGIFRFNSDGSQDTNFNASFAPYPGHGGYTVSSIAVQPDGKVLIGGAFGAVNGTNRHGIARLNANGSLDGSFNPGTGANQSVFSVALQSDGKVLIGGDFSAVNGTSRYGIARLNVNGSLDTSFNANITYWWSVKSIAFQPDGKVLIGGPFTTVNGTNRNNIARLNANGSLDSTFNPGTGAGGSIGFGATSIVLQSDGKVLIGGDFTTVNGTNRSGIARLNANGSLDNSFNSGAYSLVCSVVVQSDGKVLIAANRIFRLNANGSVDNSFDPGTQVNIFRSVALQPDGKVLLGGLFTFINGTNRYGSVRLNAGGSSDNTFVPNSFNPSIPYLGFSYDYSEITAVAVQPDGKVLVAVYYYELFNCDDSSCLYYFSYTITRHNADGSLDPSFEPVVQNSPYGYQESVSALAVQPDGKVVVGGIFFFIKGANRLCLARLNANGSLDYSFDPGREANGNVSSVVVQSDGKVIIAGDFSSTRIFRFNAYGTVDNSFNPGTGADGYVSSVAVQTDGKLLIGGEFTTFNGTNRNRALPASMQTAIWTSVSIPAQERTAELIRSRCSRMARCLFAATSPRLMAWRVRMWPASTAIPSRLP